MTTKVCNRCNKEQPLDQFNKDKTIKSGYKNQCRTCRNTGDRKRTESKRAKHMGLTEPQKLRAAANRNALLRLTQRHAAEFDELVHYELKRLKELDKDPEVKKTWISLG